jgi:hypothetical protein
VLDVLSGGMAQASPGNWKYLMKEAKEDLFFTIFGHLKR